MEYRHILVALDGSEASARAVERALELARLGGSQLTLLGVSEPRPMYAQPGRALPEVHRLLDRVERGVEAARQVGVRARGTVLHGYPPQVLVEYGSEVGCDLIVVAAGSGDGLGRTADKVADLAACAVLVVR